MADRKRYFIRVRRHQQDSTTDITSSGPVEHMMALRGPGGFPVVDDRFVDGGGVSDIRRHNTENRHRETKLEKRHSSDMQVQLVARPPPRYKHMDASTHDKSDKSHYNVYGNPKKLQKHYPEGPEILTKLKTGHRGFYGQGMPAMQRVVSSSSDNAEWTRAVGQARDATAEDGRDATQVVDVDLSSGMHFGKKSSSASFASIHTVDSKSVVPLNDQDKVDASADDTEGAAQHRVGGDDDDGASDKDISYYMKPSVIARPALLMRANQFASVPGHDAAVVYVDSVGVEQEDIVGYDEVSEDGMEDLLRCTCRKYGSKRTDERKDMVQTISVLEDDDVKRLGILRKFLRNEQNGSTSLKDISVSAEGKTFRTYRLLMAALSQYVRDLCQQEKLDLQTNLVVEGITAESVQVLLEWIEMSPVSLTPDTVHEVFRAATTLRMDSLVEKCDQYMSAMREGRRRRQGDVDIVARAEEVAERRCSRCEDMLIQKGHMAFTVEELCHWLTCDSADRSDIRRQYDMACTWLMHQWNERRQHEEQVMDCIHFDAFSPVQLRNLLSEEVNPLAQRPLIKQKLINALLHHAMRATGDKGVAEALPEGTCPVHGTQGSARKASKRTVAAIKIQSCYRGYVYRKTLKTQQHAALEIQKVYRGYRARCDMRRRNEAAAVIQSGYLRFMDRRRHRLLFDTLRKQNADHWIVHAAETAPREVTVPSSAIFLCLGGVPSEVTLNNDASSSWIYCFEANKDKWTLIGLLPKPRAEMAACMLGTRVYLTGGYDPTHYEERDQKVATVNAWSWELQTGQWLPLADMRLARRLHHVVTVGGKLYAVGGCGSNGEVLSSVECYDAATNQWTASVPLQVPRYGAAVTVHNGNVWVCGGVVDVEVNGTQKITDRVDIFQPAKSKWTKYKCLPAPRAFADAVSVNSRMLYVVGGVEYKQEEGVAVSPVVLAFDLKSGGGDWRHLADLRCARYKASAIYRDPYLVVIGGEKLISGSPLTAVECFDTEDEQWIALPDLPVALRGSCAVAL